MASLSFWIVLISLITLLGCCHGQNLTGSSGTLRPDIDLYGTTSSGKLVLETKNINTLKITFDSDCADTEDEINVSSLLRTYTLFSLTGF